MGEVPQKLGRWIRNWAAAALLVLWFVPGRACEAQTPPAEEPRLAVLSPALAVIVRDLELGRWMTARHGYDVWSEQSLAVVGDQAGIDYEAMILARPTHVLMEWGSRPLPPRLESLAAEYKWSVSNYSTLTLDDIRETTRRLSELDPGQAAWGEHRLKKEMDRAWSKREQDLGRAGRVLLLMAAEPTAAVLGPMSAHYEILKRIGGEAIPEKGAPFIEMDAEDILHLAPDAIVLIRPRAASKSGALKEREQKPGERRAGEAGDARVLERGEIVTLLGPLAKLDIPAVKSGRVALIDDPLALLPSTSLIGFADELTAVLARWAEDGQNEAKNQKSAPAR